MPFVQSLICWLGADNRQRYSLIIATCHLVFIFSTLLFPASKFLQGLILLLSLTVIICSTKRRLNDSKLTKQWLLVPGGMFLLIGSLIITINDAAIYWLLLLSLTTAAILLTYQSQKERHYIFGYSGPVDLSQRDTHRRQRIEPQLAPQLSTIDITTFAEQQLTPEHGYQTRVEHRKNNTSIDIGELIREQLLNPKNAKATLITLAVIIVSAMLITYLMTDNTNSEHHSNLTDESEEHLTANSDQPVNLRQNHLEMPDDFNLYTSAYNGLIINWQADKTSKQVLWDIRQAQGDTSCQKITFNNNDSFRTTSVIVEKADDYFAEFSPLDTRKLIKSLAARGSFTLCGYSFSLKGSQAALGKHRFYGELLVN